MEEPIYFHWICNKSQQALFSEVTDVIPGHCYEFEVCAGVAVFVEVEEHIFSQDASTQLVQEL